MYRIVIGDQAYSSWSMRGWLLLAAPGLRFRSEIVPMYDPAFAALQAAKAPARTVPMLEWEEAGDTVRVWDTMAIAETLHERHPKAGIWPQDAGHRRIARVLAAEMHSGFGALRGAAPMNIHRLGRPLQDPPETLAKDLADLEALWAWAIAATGGPWLAGPVFSAADAFFAPVVMRLTGYALQTDGTAAYCRIVAQHPAVARWLAEAKSDPRRIAHYDNVR
ncbi:MAG: glutathione S-transferase C-terminal domain-containing protein [Pseudomonadota bacterium]